MLRHEYALACPALVRDLGNGRRPFGTLPYIGKLQGNYSDTLDSFLK